MSLTREGPAPVTRVRRAVAWRPVAAAFAISLLPAMYIARFGSWNSPDGHRHQSLFDDAMISMSYARTFASGHGLVWFPGAARVEGITNLGWTLVMSGVHWVGLAGDRAVIAVKVLGLLTVWLSAVVACCMGRTFRGADSSSVRFFTALAIVINVPLLFWAVQGMEVGLLTLLTLLTCLLTWRLAQRAEVAVAESLALGAVVVAGVITRTDFAVVAFAALAWAAVSARQGLRQIALPLLGGVALAVVGTVVFRLWYYGDPVPNTYYLKLMGVPATTRIARGATVVLATSLAYIGPSVLVIAVLWKRLRRDERRLLALLLTIAGGQILYCAYVGGDAWEFYRLPDRYLTPAVVLVVLGACLAAFAAFAHDPATATSPGSWPLAVGLAVVAAAGPAMFAGILWGGVHVSAVNDPVGSESAGLKGVLLALIICLAVLGGAYLFGARHRLVAGTAFAAALTLCLLAGLAPEVVTQVNPGQNDGGASQLARLGAQLADVTTPDAVIAVTGAGASQYFSGRSMVDMLGKSDKRIAKGPTATDVFKPGHNKWDLAYSVGRLKPDVVAQSPTASDAQLRSFGYVPMRLREGTFADAVAYDGTSVIYVRRGSPNVLFNRLVPVGTR